jgi:hypothetical protein
MSKIIIYNKNDLPNSIDEIQIGSEINCILEDETRIYGKLLNNNLYNITMQQYGNKIDYKLIAKSFIKELRLYVPEENNDSKFFNPSDIKPLNYKDLDGKTLKMTIVDNDECLLVAGINKETNTIYMLHSEVKG